MVYAENGEIIKENERKMAAAGMVGPEGHALAHPEEAEVSSLFLYMFLKGFSDEI
jgi:dihydropyrimidinase